VLVADKNMEAAVSALLARHQALGIRAIRWEVFVHPARDPGCLRRCHDFLRAQSVNFEHALVLFDRRGCGSAESASTLETEVENRLHASGWGDRAKAIVIDPELEVWVWSDSPHVDEALGWTGRLPGLWHWMISEGHTSRVATKSSDPKRAMEEALRVVRVARSSAIYGQLAGCVSFERCRDPAFLRLRQTLASWFGTQKRRGRPSNGSTGAT